MVTDPAWFTGRVQDKVALQWEESSGHNNRRTEKKTAIAEVEARPGNSLARASVFLLPTVGRRLVVAYLPCCVQQKTYPIKLPQYMRRSTL